jgi:Circularly permutated YpsA SLOG family
MCTKRDRFDCRYPGKSLIHAAACSEYAGGTRAGSPMKNESRNSISAIRVISGGQTGVDRAALDAAMSLDIRIGGWCPKGRRAEDGRIPACYPLRETDSDDYALRTRLNVRDSDATLILTRGPLKGGTLLTKRYAKILGRKLWVIDLDYADEFQAISEWLVENDIGKLNIAGPRENNAPGIYQQSYGWLRRLFKVWIPGQP